MAKFKLKPNELTTGKYYVHIIIIALVVIFLVPFLIKIISLLLPLTQFSFLNKLLAFSIAIILGDILSHTILRLN